MPTTTNFYEIEIGDGEYAAVDQNRLNAQRGTFVESGGQITPGTSTSTVTLNAEATEFRADLEPYTLNESQPAVTIPANSTPYPRRDLVYAEVPQSEGGTASYGTLEGEPIDTDENATLVEAGIIDDDGLPIAPVVTIPEVQPPSIPGFLNERTLLAMVYVPPNTQDATDLTDTYVTDLREPGGGPVDVLRTGEAVSEIEGYDVDANGPIDTTVANSAAIDDVSYASLQKRRPNFHVTGKNVASGSQIIAMLAIPSGMTLKLWGLGASAASGVGSGGGASARLVDSPGGDLFQREDGVWGPSQGSGPRKTIDGPNAVFLAANNTGPDTVDYLIGSMAYTLVTQ